MTATRRHRTRRSPAPRRARLRLGLLAIAVVTGVMLASAPAASAHAVVVSSNPSDGERLTTSPAAVSIQFSESVSADLGGLRVVSSSGQSVVAGTDTVSGPTLSVALQPDLPDGTYVATYRVISADGHPVKGALVFAVGDASTAGVDTGSFFNGSSSDRTFEVLGAISRFLGYVGALTAAGLAFFLAFLHDGGPEAGPLARVVRGAAVVAVIGALGTLGTQAALATGRSWSAVFDPAVLHDVLNQTLDLATLLLLAGLLIVLVSLEVPRRGSRQTLAFYGGLASCVSFLFWGHTLDSPDRWVALVANGVHLVAAALWAGGLVGLAVVLRRRTVAARPQPDDRPSAGTAPARPASSSSAVPATDSTVLVADRGTAVDHLEQLQGTASIVSRFSTMALVSVLALWAAGGALAWIEVGSVDAFTSTTYGKLVLSKIGVVVVIAAFAGYNRFRLIPEVLDEVRLATDLGDDETVPSELVQAALVDDPDLAGHAQDEARTGLRRMSRTVVVEALLIVVVLAITSVLVNTTPARSASETQGIANQTLPITTSTPGSTLNLVVAPAKAGGQNSLHLSYADPQGRPVAVSGPVKVEFSLPSADIGPISRDALPGGSGHYLLDTTDITIPGVWTITVITRLGEFDQQRTAFSVKIR
ncbi:MAG: copper resistance CopC/CopD family protein [Acidimicrobiales bacterium]